ncbi:MAG: cyclodeaminase/cyclohydrolase family protein [Tissierellia bacterium]|nr:cyclodeaminase/cyclohydrolase family protein [Tissierellia bacterium]
MLIENTLKEYVNAVQSGDPTPGGGSVAALAGSLGAALTNMVGNLTFGKKAYNDLDGETQKKLEENFKELEKSVDILMAIVDEDSTAFDGVMNALKMPKETDEEKENRSKAIQEGYKEALIVPLKCAKECLHVLELQEVFAHHGNINAITDVGVGTLLAYTGLEGALFNVYINLKSIKDEDFRKETEETAYQLLSKGKILRDELLEEVYRRLN